MKQVTIKDLAKELGISYSTVSRALRDHPDISAKTIEKVKKLAKKKNYQPDVLAQYLQKKQSKTIGVIVPEIRHNFFSSAISGIEEVSYNKGYTIIVSQSQEFLEREKKNLQGMISNRIAGLIMSVSQETKSSEHLELIKGRGIPIVLFDRVLEDFESSKVINNDYGGAYKAVSFLVEKGYERIAYLGGKEYLLINQERLRGYKEGLISHKRKVIDDYIVFSGLEEGDGAEGIIKLLKLNPKPDAVLCVNDPVAIGAYGVVKNMGLKIPDDIAFIGFSNDPLCRLLSPPLTTINQLSYEMGKFSAELLFEQIENMDLRNSFITKVIETELIIREST